MGSQSTFTRKIRPKIISPPLPEPSEWREYHLEDLFDILSSRKIFHAQDVQIFDTCLNGTFPYIVRSSLNNGIRGFISQPKMYLNPANTLSFAQDTFTVFYQSKPYFTGNKVKVLKFKFGELNRYLAIYLAGAFQKSLATLSWGVGSTIKSIAKIKIALPTKSNLPDYNYMIDYIQKIEAYYVQKIEAYLTILGYKTIDDLELTELDLLVIEEWNNSKFGNFLLEDLFQWKPNIEFSPLKLGEYIDDTEENRYPFVGQSTSNHGRISYHHLRKELLNNPTGKPTLLIHSNNQNIEYIDTPFYLKDGHGATSILQANFLTKTIARYLQTIISKVITERFSYNGKATKIGLKKTSIELPVLKNKQLNTKLMNDYIKVIEKKVVKHLKIELDQRLDKYNKLIK